MQPIWHNRLRKQIASFDGNLSLSKREFNFASLLLTTAMAVLSDKPDRLYGRHRAGAAMHFWNLNKIVYGDMEPTVITLYHTSRGNTQDTFQGFSGSFCPLRSSRYSVETLRLPGWGSGSNLVSTSGNSDDSSWIAGDEQPIRDMGAPACFWLGKSPTLVPHSALGGHPQDPQAATALSTG